MHKSRPIIAAPALALLATLLVALPCRGVEAVSSRPHLVLGIMVEGLQADYLRMLSDRFGADGFNKLINGGMLIDNVDYGPGVDAAGATAMIYTGAAPSVNGISRSTVYNVERRLPQSVLLDGSKIGNYTQETLSPSAIRVSTLGDEIRIDGGGVAYVHSLAPDAVRAIIMAGHAGNSAFWINDVNGQWATTTHYRDVPTAITTRNYSQPLNLKLDTLRWTPSIELDDYPAVAAHKRRYPFEHTFTRAEADRYSRFKTAAPVNKELTDLAVEYLNSMRLGRRDAIDMLSVAYTVAPYAGSLDPEARLETLDAYLRLDREVSRLLQAAEQHGVQPVVFVAGTPAPASTRPDDAKWNLSTGEFSAKKAVSLLNMYLIATHGNGEWIRAYHDGGFYLNHDLIEQKKLNDEDLRADAAKFLMRMTGVADAHTIDDILEGRRSDAERRNTVVANAPDVYVDVIPGWTIVDDTAGNKSVERKVMRAAATSAPVIFYAPGRVESGRLSTPVDARSIAPTVARILRIRSPNGAAQSPVYQLF